MEESKYTIKEAVELLNSVDDLKSKIKKLSEDKAELENQLEFKYNDMRYVLIERQTLRDIVSSLEDSVSNSMCDAENTIGDIESYISDAQYSIGDAQSCVGDCINDIETILEESDPNDE